MTAAPPIPSLLGMASASWMAQALHAAASLDVAAHINDGARTPDTLAEKTGAHAPSLLRLLRALSSIDICREKDGGFELTDTGRLLDARHPQSLKSWIIWWGTQLWQDFGGLAQSVKTGERARQAGTFTADIFQSAMTELTRLTTAGILASCDFSRFAAIADIGGGRGELLSAIIAKYPHIKGILFDLQPQALPGLTCVTGDFFDRVPEGADLYILKSVLHDWADDKALQILASCRKTNKPLLLIERLMPENISSTPAHRDMARADLTMLVAHGAAERTEKDFRRLLEQAGFRVESITPTGMAVSLIAAVPS